MPFFTLFLHKIVKMKNSNTLLSLFIALALLTNIGTTAAQQAKPNVAKEKQYAATTKEMHQKMLAYFEGQVK
jgi:hypothetical protein